jgi:PTH1 family peptidyl-tRNA hydrolase
MVMKAIIGLGNPGAEYEGTRHNAGFLVVDRLLEAAGGRWGRTRFKGLAARARIAGAEVVLGKPTTFMNLSGFFVSPLLNFYGLALDDLLVIHDDIDLPMGRLRFLREGGSGGHKGVQSLIEQLGTNRFCRLKLGVGRPETGGEVVNFVLSRFSRDDAQGLESAVEDCVRAVPVWVHDGIGQAMNAFNAKKTLDAP